MGRINSRAKGKAGELEVLKILRDELGEVIGSSLARNLDQTRDGGHDIVGLQGWAIEVKRSKTSSIPMWWEQTCRQAGSSKIPALWYRLDRREWRVIIPMGVVTDLFEYSEDLEWTIEMTPTAFCAIVREEISARELWKSRHQNLVGQPH